MLKRTSRLKGTSRLKRDDTATELARRLGSTPSTNPRVPPMGAAGFALLGAALMRRHRARRAAAAARP